MSASDIGTVFRTSLGPIDENSSRTYDLGVVKIAVEHRHVTNETLLAAFDSMPKARAEALAATPAGLDDRGISIHVVGVDDGHEYLRFDCLEKGPHYHYNLHQADGALTNVEVRFDPYANGDSVSWALGRIRERLPEMLAAAGGYRLAKELNSAETTAVVSKIETFLAQATGEFAAALESARGVGQ